ncbi:cobyric acid synthase [Aquipuribacter sp. MA13-6]|uniref:cobyric acid synthase n=1 Tax=unclassified Aquipuribacter TaxID=2635084 RepID=UPI003EEC320D
MSAVMVLGCTSWAGKSLLATALCRWYADQGLRVAPFKGQNMSNNARVVRAGETGAGEIGVAQWLQARAARVEADVRMNPVLIKPERDGSQVVVLGRVDEELSRRSWTARPPGLWGPISAGLDALLAEHDLVVCEGAGSPAETNLRDTDLANLRVARHADAPALLVADIDRGGAFAHLLGTWLLVDEADRGRLAGFVLNKFRGDPALLREAPVELSARTGMAHAGVMPMLAHRLPDEDGARDLTPLLDGDLGAGDVPDVAVLRYPSASNLDELTLLAGVARVRWADSPAAVTDADLVVLPGSKHVHADLAWLRARGLDRALAARVSAGRRVLGICGGLQMLGQRLGPEPVGGGSQGTTGLALLPVQTTYAATKRTAHTRATFRVPVGSPWARLSGLEVKGYDIRHGTTRAVEGAPAVAPVLGEEHGWAHGPVLGLAGHGALEDPAVVEAVVGRRPVDRLEETLDALSAAVETHLDTDLLRRLTRGLL